MDIRFNHIKQLQNKLELDLNNSILIIGKASSNNLSGELIRAKNIDDIKNAYGESDLAKAAQYVLSLKDEVYLYNTYESEHYIDIVKKFNHYDFNYIVPIGINITDQFYNKYLNKKMTYAEFYLDNLPQDSNSIIIMTDKHAELYEDMDDYMLTTENNLFNIKTNAQDIDSSKWTNLVFVCNMLTNVEYSNVVLATQLAITRPGKYPQDITHTASYDYDTFDIASNDICYYKNNLLNRYTSVENLVNMRNNDDVYKSILIDIVLKYIKRNLKLDKYRGTSFNSYTKIQIANDIKRFMNPISGDIIKNYNIKSINFVLTGPNVGNVLIEMEITPRGTFESLQVNLEV